MLHQYFAELAEPVAGTLKVAYILSGLYYDFRHIGLGIK